MKKGFFILFVLFMQVLASAQVSQVLWFVSPTGSDVSGNGTISAPFKTVAKAKPYLTPGDTLYFRSGTYTNLNYGNGDVWKDEQSIKLSSLAGTSSAYIVLKPYANEKAIIRGDGNFLFQLWNCSYVKIIGFEIYGETENITLNQALAYQFAYRDSVNAEPTLYRLPPGTNTNQSGLPDISTRTIFRPSLYNGHGIVIQNSHHIDILNNLVHHLPGEGIRYASSDYINIIGNEVHNCARRNSTGVHGISGYSCTNIDTSSAVKILIAKNIVHDNYCELASWSQLKTIFQAAIDEGKGITVQRINSGTGYLKGRIRLENNLTYNNGFSGLHVNGSDRIDIINNTSYRNSKAGRGNNIGISVQDANDIKIVNNIVEADLSWGGYSINAANSTLLYVTKNLVNGGLNTDIANVATSTITGSASFVDTLQKNFKLSYVSPAINSALASVAPVTDIIGTSRGTAPDMGCYEFVPPAYRLFNFSGLWTSSTQINLTWSVENTTAVNSFSVYNSTDNRTWRLLGTVSVSNRNYGIQSFTYNHASPSKKTNYYRIQTNFSNNTTSTSSTITIAYTGLRLAVFPNPAAEEIVLNGLSENDKLNLFDLKGRCMNNVVSFHKRFKDEAVIDISRLVPGSYYITTGLSENRAYFIKR